MNRQVLEDQLNQISASDEQAITKLADTHKFQSYAAARSAADIWLERGHPNRPAAEMLLTEYGELSIRPLIEVHDKTAWLDLAWLLDTAVTAELQLRAQMLQQLEALMQNKTLIPQVPMKGPIEEPVPEVRVCDEAYLQARRLSSGEGPEQRVLNEDAYLQLAFDERDEEIMKYTQSRVWTDLMDSMDEHLGE